jgi:hypothetical protein
MKDTKYVIIHGVDGMEEGYSETEAVLFTRSGLTKYLS